MDVPKVVEDYVKNLVPPSIFSEITSFVIVCDYAKWPNRPDIVVTTKRRELIELKDRQPLRSLEYDDKGSEGVVTVDKILLHFNRAMGKAPNYVVKSNDRVFIVVREDGEKEGLKVLSVLEDITRLELDDPAHSGESKIRLWRLGGGLPVVLDDSYVVHDGGVILDVEDEEDEAAKVERVVSVLAGNLSEAKLNTARNWKTYEEKRLFRQKVSHVVGEDNRYDSEGAAYEKGCVAVDKLKVENVWQKVNNGKWTIGIPIRNVSNGTIDDITLTLISGHDDVLFYKIVTYVKDEDTSLHWKMFNQKPLDAGETITIVAVLDLPSFDFGPRAIIKGSLNYKFETNSFSLPLSNIEIKAGDVTKEELNSILCNIDNFGSIDILSIIVTSVIKHLKIYFIDDGGFNIKNFLIEKLEYSCNETNFPGLLRHSKSPLHSLHGTIIIFENKDNNICILSRNYEQLLMLLSLIYDSVPMRIIIIPHGYKIEFKKRPLSNDKILSEKYSEDMDYTEETHHFGNDESLEYGSALYEQMSLISQHLVKCTDAMSESNFGESSSKADASMDIDVLALGINKYEEVWEKIHKQTCIQNRVLNKLSHV